MNFVSSATMTIEFDLQRTLPRSSDSEILQSPFSCEIIIVDDRGKEYKNKHEGWWYPETE